MKSPIFKQVSEKVKSTIPLFPSGKYRELETELTRIIMENREALIMAWLAETGLKPSESEMIQKWEGGTLRLRIKKRDDAR